MKDCLPTERFLSIKADVECFHVKGKKRIFEEERREFCGSRENVEHWNGEENPSEMNLSRCLGNEKTTISYLFSYHHVYLIILLRSQESFQAAQKFIRKVV